MTTLLKDARRLLENSIGLTSVEDHPRIRTHRTLAQEKAGALAAANADVSTYAAELQRIAANLREARVAGALGEASLHDEAALRAKHADVDKKLVEAQERCQVLRDVIQRLADRESTIIAEVTAETAEAVRRRDRDLVPVVMALAETLIDLNAKRLDLHRLGLDANLLPVFQGGEIARWLTAAQAAGFQPSRK